MANARILSTSDTIAETLRRAILVGELAAGSPLRQEHIAAQHGVSHIPVREALRRLEADGLVVHHRRRGVFVAEVNADHVLEITEMRLALETLALRLAIPNATDQDRRACARIIERAEHSSELAEWSDLNWEFHRTLYAPCARPRLMETVETLWRNVDRYIRVVWRVSDYQDRPNKEHRSILAAYRPKTAKQAEKLLHSHIVGATEIAVAFLKKPKKSL